MKKIILSLSLSFSAFVGMAQTAPDFTAVDCASNSHTLYTELSGGNVAVLVWIMPCGACVNGAKAAYNAVQSFASSHPGKVKYFLIDDVGDATCSSLLSWANTNTITAPTAIFSNAGTPINESNYGGSGMPHVMVVGPDYKILFNGLNGAANNLTGITNAINTGLTPASIAETQVNKMQIELSPNPANSLLELSFVTEDASDFQLSIVNTSGQVVVSKNLSASKGNHKEKLDISNLPNGNYFVNINNQTLKFSIAR